MLLLLLGLTLVLLNINSIAGPQINKALNAYLTEGGSLNTIDIQLMGGRVDLAGLTINTPKGFGKEPLLSLKQLEVDIDPMSIFSDAIVVKQVNIDDLSLTVVRDEKGQFSPLKLLSPEVAATKPESADDGDEQAAFSIPAIRVNSIRLENLSIRLIDKMVGKQWSAGLRVDSDVMGLQINDLLNLDILLDKFVVAVSGIKVDQPAGFSQIPFLNIDKFEVASAGIDIQKSRLPINKILLNKMQVSVEQNRKGAINLIQLINAWVPENANTDKKQPSAPAKANSKNATTFKVPTFIFKDIQLTSIAMQLLAHIEGKPWRAGFDKLDAGITGLEVGDIAQKAISLDSFTLDLKGLAADQPPGFDKGKLASLKRVGINTERIDLASPEIVVKDISAEGFASSVMTNSDGLSNLQKLVEALLETNKPKSKSEAKPAVESKKAAPENKLPPVHFERIQLANGSVKLSDESLTDETLVIPLENILVKVSQLRLFENNQKAKSAAASVSFEMGQPGTLPTAYFGSFSKIGPVSSDVPLVNSQVRITGFKLDTLGSLIPPTTRATVGATGFDATLSLALNSDSIHLKGSALSDRNVRYKALKVQGPLDAPKIEMGVLLAGVYSRVSDGLLNLGKGGLSAGVTIIGTGVNVVGEVGSGVLNVGKSIGSGLIDAGAGLVTFDQEELKKGLSGTTKGTVDVTVDSARGTGSAAGEGVKSSASDLEGGKRVKAWNEGIPERHKKAMEKVPDALSKMPYPPVTN